MISTAIRLNKISKQYRLGVAQGRYKTLRDSLSDAACAPYRAVKRMLHRQSTAGADKEKELLWALHDVSCEIKSGEVVGIIGRNGAGKSTLLKVLARITAPTSGSAEIHGRIGSLLEVGTGFHNELTGRENTFLAGAILGMSKSEILRKFDEIVAFAELEKFIDTPVKHYSSGMYMRLGFAVAAHLEPEILLVDEVLAVGDSTFQKKCMNKMQAVGQEGRTVLFVSHNMSAITRLCKRGILLQDGHIVEDGAADKVAAAYLNLGLETSAAREWPDPEKAPCGDTVRLRAVRIRDEAGEITATVDIRRPIAIEVEYDVLRDGRSLLPHCVVLNGEGQTLFQINDLDPEWRLRPRPAGRYVTQAWIPGNLLSEGTHIVSAYICLLDPYNHQCHEKEAVSFQVVDTTEGDSARGDWQGGMLGLVRPAVKWTTAYGMGVDNGKLGPSPSRPINVSLVTEPILTDNSTPNRV